MKKFILSFSFLAILFIGYSNNATPILDLFDFQKPVYLKTNTILMDTKGYDLVKGTNYEYGYSKEHGVYIFTLSLETLVSEKDNEFIVSTFNVYSESENLKPGIYKASSLTEEIKANKFSYGSTISRGPNSPSIFLSQGALEISKSSNDTFKIDYVGEKNGATIKIHFEGKLETEKLTN